MLCSVYACIQQLLKQCLHSTTMYTLIINPLRMRSRVTVVCLSAIAITAQVLVSAVQTHNTRNQLDTYKVFDSWILLKAVCSKVMARLPLRSVRP